MKCLTLFSFDLDLFLTEGGSINLSRIWTECHPTEHTWGSLLDSQASHFTKNSSRINPLFITRGNLEVWLKVQSSGCYFITIMVSESVNDRAIPLTKWPKHQMTSNDELTNSGYISVHPAIAKEHLPTTVCPFIAEAWQQLLIKSKSVWWNRQRMGHCVSTCLSTGL